jgi:hypothetical protein
MLGCLLDLDVRAYTLFARSRCVTRRYTHFINGLSSISMSYSVYTLHLTIQTSSISTPPSRPETAPGRRKFLSHHLVYEKFCSDDIPGEKSHTIQKVHFLKTLIYNFFSLVLDVSEHALDISSTSHLRNVGMCRHVFPLTSVCMD